MRHILTNKALKLDEDYQAHTKPAGAYVLDEVRDIEAQEVQGAVSTDFAGALRLLLFSDKVIQPFEKKFIIDALSLGLDEMPESEKVALAEALCKTGKVSQQLADRLLLTGSDQVQKILVERYAYHSDRALELLAQKATSEVLLSLAERRSLPSGVVLALVSREEIDATRLVLENKTALRSREVIVKLLAQGLSDSSAALSLLNVPDMEPSLALKLFWQVDADVRAVILRRFLRSHILVEGHFARIKTPHLRRLPFFSANHDMNEDAVTQGLQAAIDYIRQGQNESAFKLLSLCVPLSLNLLEKIFHDKGGEALLVLLKALGLKRGVAQKYIVSLADSAIAREWSAHESLIEIYDTISWAEARMALSYWLWQDLSLGAYGLDDDARFFENILETGVPESEVEWAVPAE